MSTTAASFDPVLLRQLKKAGLVEPNALPTSESWARFLGAVNDHYRHLNEDRALLTRSMELSTGEMEQLRRSVEDQRDQLTAILDVIGNALGLFGGIVHEDADASSMTGELEAAKNAFRAQLEGVFSSTSEDTGQISGIRTNLVKLADQMIRLLAETAERASVKKELEVARAVQNLLVPTTDVMDREHVQIAGHFLPASECGGDWWAVYDLPDGRILTLVGDATGHGISSAIITGAAKAACDLACNITKGRLSPSDLLQMMSSAIHETARRQIMMTCIVGVFDPATWTLTVANAGHHFPYHVREGVLRPIMVQGQPLGASATSTYESTTVSVSPNDVFVWFTDGIVETENAQGEQFSEKKLRAICQRTAKDGARAVRDAVVEAVATFRQDRPQADDMTLVVTALK